MISGRLILDYLKFIVGIGVVLYGHFIATKYKEIIIIIGALIIATSGVKLEISHRKLFF